VAQIMTLLNFAPDIQEAILFLPRVVEERVTGREERPLAAENNCRRQLRL